jgi:hypothetical protein
MTLIVASEEGATHCPPMKKRSVWRIGTLGLVLIVTSLRFCGSADHEPWARGGGSLGNRAVAKP